MMRTWLFYRLGDGTWIDQSISATEALDDHAVQAWVSLNTPAGCGAFERTSEVDQSATRFDLLSGKITAHQEPTRQRGIERAAALRAIVHLEAQQGREVREALIAVLPDGPEKQRLLDREAKISAQRAKL